MESEVLGPAAPTDSRLWDGTDTQESCTLSAPRFAALPFPSTLLHERSASRLVSCDISLKQPSLGELACTQERWFWRRPFPSHLQTGARTKRWEKTRPRGYARQLPLLQGKKKKSAKGKSEGEACTHQKEIISAKSRLFKNQADSHLPAALTPPAEEMGFSSARTGFRARQPGGDEASPASPALWQGPHPGRPGDGESQHPQPPHPGAFPPGEDVWQQPGNWLQVDLISFDFLFCKLQPSLLKLFPLLNNKRCFQHGIRSSSANREAPAPSSPSATKVPRLKLNRTQPPLLGRELNPVILCPTLNNKMGLRDRSLPPSSALVSRVAGLYH